MIERENLIGKIFQDYTLKVELAATSKRWIYLGEKDSNVDLKQSVTFIYFYASPIREPATRTRFLEQMHQFQQLHHANIVSVLFYGLDQDIPYLATPFAPQRTLQTHLRRQEMFSHPEALRIITQIGQALHIAHQHGIVHGHLSPHAILLDSNGDALLTDFSITLLEQLVDVPSPTGSLTTEEALSLAPEQREGTLLPASDQYALGYLASILLTGHAPLSLVVGLPERRKQQSLTGLRIFHPALSGNVERVIMKATASYPDERYQSIAAFLEALLIAVQHEEGGISTTIAEPRLTDQEKVALEREAPHHVISTPDVHKKKEKAPQTRPIVLQSSSLKKQSYDRYASAQKNQNDLLLLKDTPTRRGRRLTKELNLLLIVLGVAVVCALLLPFVGAFSQKARALPSLTPSHSSLSATYSQQQTQEVTLPSSSGKKRQPTPSPNSTSTPTPTFTPNSTSTPTSASTSTQKPTVTPTPTQKPTAEPGQPVVYSFEDGSIDGWQADACSLNNSTAIAQSGEHSLMVTQPAVDVNPANGYNPYIHADGGNDSQLHAGQIVSAYIYVPVGSIKVDADISLADAHKIWYDSSQLALSQGIWNFISFTVPTFSAPMSEIGIDLYYTTISGNTVKPVYIDDISW